MFAKLTSLVSGASLPCTLGESRGVLWCGWEHFEGSKVKEDGSRASVFKKAVPVNDSEGLDMARNGVKRLRSLKHPGIVSFKDSLEVPDRTNVTFYLITEPVSTLESFLREDDMSPNNGGMEVIAWGLKSVAGALNFLNSECKLIHGNICLTTVLVTENYDWKLAFFDLVTEHQALAGAGMGVSLPLMSGHKLLPRQYFAGELHKGAWADVSSDPPWSVDAWGLGCLLQEVFRGQRLESVAQLKEKTAMPAGLANDYMRLLNAQPGRRLNPVVLVDRNTFFTTKLGEIMEFLDSLIIREEGERSKFFRDLVSASNDLPQFFIGKKILPACMAALEYGSVPTSALHAILDLLGLAGQDVFDAKALPFLSKMFKSNDVTTILVLLQKMDKYLEYLTSQAIEATIYPAVQPCFKSMDPRIRDQSIKCMSSLAPKMTQKLLNSSLLPSMAQLQRDPEAAIRTNTTVLLSKISPHLGEASCKRILLNAFTRVLGDPASSVRNAATLALMETSQYYAPDQVATKLVPCLAPLVADTDLSVASNALKCMERFAAVLREHVAKREAEARAEEVPDLSQPTGSSRSDEHQTPLAAAALAVPMPRVGAPAGNGSRQVGRTSRSGSLSHPNSGRTSRSGSLTVAGGESSSPGGWEGLEGLEDMMLASEPAAKPAAKPAPILQAAPGASRARLSKSNGAAPRSPRARGGLTKQHVQLGKDSPKVPQAKPMKLGVKPLAPSDDWGDLLK